MSALFTFFWLVVWNMFYLSISWECAECHHPSWRTPSFFRGVAKNHQPALVHMAMDQYLLIAFLGGWTSIYKLFWGSPGVQGFGTLPYEILVILLVLSYFGDGMKIPGRWLLPLFDGWSGLPHKTNLTFLHKSNVNGSENHGKAMTRILFVESMMMMMMMIKKPLVLMVVCGVMILPYTSVDCWVSGCLSVLPAFRGLRKQLLSIAVLIVFMEDPVGCWPQSGDPKTTGGSWSQETYLIGGDWNHGILNDFPFSWE